MSFTLSIVRPLLFAYCEARIAKHQSTYLSICLTSINSILQKIIFIQINIYPATSAIGQNLTNPTKLIASPDFLF